MKFDLQRFADQTISSGGSYNINESNSTITIATSEAVTLSGNADALTEVVITTTADNADLTLENLNITNATNGVIVFGSGTENKLNVAGTNTLAVQDGGNACINVGGGLTASGTGSLKGTSSGGAVIGVDANQDGSGTNIAIESGTYDLTADGIACAIGGAGESSSIGDISIDGTAQITATNAGGKAAAIGAAYRGSCGNITIGETASVVANANSTENADAAIGSSFGQEAVSIGDIKIIDDATVTANSAAGLALDNRLYADGATVTNASHSIFISSASIDTSTADKSTVILNNADTSDIVTIDGVSRFTRQVIPQTYQGKKIVFYDGDIAMTGNWTSVEGGGFAFQSVIQSDYTGGVREEKVARFTVAGGNLKDEDNDEIPDNVSIASIIYIAQSGPHTSVRHLGGNVEYTNLKMEDDGTLNTLSNAKLGVDGDDDYYIEAISPVDLSERHPLGYNTDWHVTVIRGISDGATISPRGTAGTKDIADWISLDDGGNIVTFKDGSYSMYTESMFPSSNYTRIYIDNDDAGLKLTTASEAVAKELRHIPGTYVNVHEFEKISNLQDNFAITIESGLNVGESMDFETSGGSGVIVVKTTTNTLKNSLSADAADWQWQRYSVSGTSAFTLKFDSDHGSVVGFESSEGTISGWGTLNSGEFEFIGNATNNPEKISSFIVAGDSITSTDNLSVSPHVYLEAQDVSRLAVNGLSGKASIDGEDLGIEGDDSYTAHFAPNQDDKAFALFNVSDGATVNNNYAISVEDNSNVKFSDGLHTIFTADYAPPTPNYTTISASNGGEGFSLSTGDINFETISGLNNGYEISIAAGGNIGDKLAFKTDGGQGTIVVGESTLEVDGDEDFAVNITEDGIIGLNNFDGAATLLTGVGGFDTYMPLAIQHKQILLATDSDSANMTLTNGAGDSLDIYYVGTNGGVIDLSDQTLTNALLVGYGTSSTLIGSKGGDHFIGTSANLVQTGGSGKDTFAPGYGVQSLIITDYEEGEDVLYLRKDSETSEYNFLYLDGDNYGIGVPGSGINILGGANKKIAITDQEGNAAYYGNYLTVLDADPDTITVTSNVKTIDLTSRTTDVVAYGNSLNNTIISSAGDCTLYGGEGEDTFVRGNRTNEQTIVVADFTEDEDEVYHGRPFSSFSLLEVASVDGNDYVFKAGTAEIRYTDGADKKIKFRDVNGDIAYFGNYITVLDVDSDTITATENVKTIDASVRTKDVEIIANALDNTIIAGASETTINGGEGADYISLNSAAALVEYTSGDGNDTIAGFNSNSTLSISDGSYSKKVSGDDLILTVGENTITLEDSATLDANIIGTKKTASDEILDSIAADYDYGTPITDAEEVATLLEEGDLDGDMALLLDKQSADFRKTEGSKNVTLEGGNQNISFNNEGGNVAVIDDDATGKKNISLGGGLSARRARKFPLRQARATIQFTARAKMLKLNSARARRKFSRLQVR